jgi:hypothetical protein
MVYFCDLYCHVFKPAYNWTFGADQLRNEKELAGLCTFLDKQLANSKCMEGRDRTVEEAHEAANWFVKQVTTMNCSSYRERLACT